MRQGGINMEGVLGDGLEGNFWVEGLPLCVQSKFECLHGGSGHNILWQLFPVWVYSDAERMLTTTSLTPLLVNLQSLTPEPSAGGGSKDCVTRKVEGAVNNFVHADKVKRILLRIWESSCSRWRAVSYGTWRNPFTKFTASS